MFWLVLALAIALWLMPGSTPALDRHRHPHGLNALERVQINGVWQWISIRSHDVANPIVLFLHGGPGTSMLGLMRRDTRALEEHFTVVHWDQRGAGKSYAAGSSDPARMTIRAFVSDVIALAEHLRARFHQEQLVLVGHSWGSAIGVLAAAERPDLFSAYVGVGQMSNASRSEQLSYAWTLERAQQLNDSAGLTKLRQLGAPPYTGADWRKKFMAQRALLARYGGEVHGNSMGAMAAVLQNLCSREYTMLDRCQYFRGIFRSVAALGPELSQLNLFEQAPKLEVPVYFCLGRHDYEVPSSLSAAYFDALTAPRKQLVWFEHSAHMPVQEEREVFNQFMVQTVLPGLQQHPLDKVG